MEYLSKKWISGTPASVLTELPEKVLQFGTGVLLRGLPDYLINRANQQGIFNGRIVVVKSTSTGDTNSFAQQDNLYTICTRGVSNGEVVHENTICTAISRVLSASDEWAEILACAANPDLQIILSNTTEVGIKLVQEDIFQSPPSSFPAKLLAFLHARYQAFSGAANRGIVIVPTELIPDNGRQLETIVLELAQYNGLEKPFVEWLGSTCIFCNSLVDRIVPGAPPATQKSDFFAEIGYLDDLLITVEPYCFFAIEGDQKVADILSFQQAWPEAMAIESDITRYRERKLRLLNGTHTLTCAVAHLAGFSTVDETMSDPEMAELVEWLMFREIAPSIPCAISTEEVKAFGRQVIDRFSNPFVEHRWLSIAAQYALKMKTRIVPLILEHYRQQSTPPQGIALCMAAFLVFYRQPHPTVQDEGYAYFSEKWAHTSPELLVPEVLADSGRWGVDLSQLPGFADAVTKAIQQILAKGAADTVRTFLSQTHEKEYITDSSLG